MYITERFAPPILKYALFITFFPQIIQGPIPRYEKLGNELFEGHTFNSQGFMNGIQLIIWGFFLKFMIADKASIIVNTVFNNFATYNGLYVWIAAILYSLQLYTDFLACVTLSQGISLLFGISIDDNFQRPYFATSVKDFWRRWHMSLSSWLRDYVYIPLGGNRKGTCRKNINLLITFIVSGIWHGGQWSFVFWGLLHALYQIVGQFTKKMQKKAFQLLYIDWNSMVGIFIRRTFTFFWVMLAWIIFRATNLKIGLQMIKRMFTAFNPWIFFDNSLFRLGLSQKEWEVLIFAIVVLVLVSTLQERCFRIRNWFGHQAFLVRWIVYLASICCIWVLGTYGYGFDAKDFIYGGF